MFRGQLPFEPFFCLCFCCFCCFCCEVFEFVKERKKRCLSVVCLANGLSSSSNRAVRNILLGRKTSERVQELTSYRQPIIVPSRSSLLGHFVSTSSFPFWHRVFEIPHLWSQEVGDLVFG